MGKAAQGREWHPWDTVVESRATLTATEALGARFHQVLSPRGAARTPGWKRVAVAQAALDAAKAVWLSRSDRFAFLPRWVLDAADLVLWCFAAQDNWDTSEDAVVPGVALAAEAAARWGPTGLMVPLANAGVAAAVRSRRGHQLRLEQFSWPMMGTVGGWALRLLAERRRGRLDADHQAERDARLQRAEMAGFHDLIVEHEGAVDILQRAAALVELGAPGVGARSLMAAIKAAAADTARRQATYLGDALAAWQAGHNQRPELAAMVDMHLAPGAGVVLLSSSQVSRLHAELDRLALHGRLSVNVVDTGGRERPFGPCRLVLGSHVVTVPADEAQARWVLDATPVAFLMGLGWLAQPTGAHREGVPWSVTVPPMVAALLAALYWARREDANAAVSPLGTVVVSAGITMGYTVASTRAMRNPHTDEGVSRFPWVMALQGYELVRGIPYQESNPATRLLGLAGTAAVIATGWCLSPRPRSARALVAELGWVVAFDAYTRRLRRATVEAGSRLSESVVATDGALEAEAYARGRERALSVVVDALEAERRDLARRGHELQPAVRDEAARRLDQVAASLGLLPRDAALSHAVVRQ